MIVDPPATAGGTDLVQADALKWNEVTSSKCDTDLSIDRVCQLGAALPHPHMWNDTDTPLAYLLSFRTYGTWLHGDERGSIDRFHNHYGSPYLTTNTNWYNFNQRALKTKPLTLDAIQRKSVEVAIRETCKIRKWTLLALNVRTNHVHVVVTANAVQGRVLNALKANATRQLRVDGLWAHCFSPWADKGSNRKLWNEESVSRAVDYVLYGQGDELPDFDD